MKDYVIGSGGTMVVYPWNKQLQIKKNYVLGEEKVICMVLDLTKGTFKIYENEEKDENLLVDMINPGSLKGKYYPIISLYFEGTTVKFI